MKLGLLGGTFDPPHNGHLQLAREAARALQLEQVVFIPARQPPHKLDDPVSPLKARVAMLKRALEGHPDFVISMMEAERAGPSYTVDTLRELRRELGPNALIYFIMGEDSLVNLPTWNEPQEIIRLCRPVVLQRPGYDLDLDALEKKVPGIKERVVMVDAPELDISSSDIRERVRRGASIRRLVPTAVADYIKRHHLYKT
jgi:nicotinate-nucleotide adenylyltransferase